MLGDLAIAYLFLGGAGAGALLVCCLADLIWLREPFGRERLSRGLSRWPVERLVGLSLLAGLLMVLAGAVCLTFDLGRVDRLVSLLLSPPTSLMNWGSWALALLIILAFFIVFCRFLSVPAVGRGAVVAAEAVTVAVALFVMGYTGFLLQTLYGARFWGLWPVVALFVLSSLSCGIAVPVMLQMVVGSDEFTEVFAVTLIRIDLLVIALEAIAASILLVLANGSSHPGIQASFASLVQGTAAPWWWAGFALCGLAIPLVCELATVARPYGPRLLRFSVAAAVLVLVGGACLRVAIVDAGSYRPLELMAPAASANVPQDSQGEGGFPEDGSGNAEGDGSESADGNEDSGNWGAHLFGRDDGMTASRNAPSDRSGQSASANTEDEPQDGFPFNLQ